MIKLMQTASVLTLTAALAFGPQIATAQQTTEQGSQAAGTAAEQAAEQAGQAAEQAGEAVGAAAEQVTDQAGQAAEQASEAAGAAADQVTGQGDQAAEQGSQATEQGGQTAEQPAAEGAEMPAATTGTAEGQQPVAEVPGAIVMQDKDSILASNLLGATVYNPKGEAIGNINDAIISLDGTVDGVVIGVGGFLGMGEKGVAIDLQEITLQTDESNQPQLLLDTTYEALEAAPAFVDAQTQAEEEQQKQMEQQQPTDTAPGTGMAPEGGASAPASAN